MIKPTDEELTFVSAEQKNTRRILISGLGILIVLVVMSAALGVYYYQVSRNLEATSANLERNAFDARLAADRQTNRVAFLERAVRRTYDEFRAASAGQVSAKLSEKEALAAAANYLRLGSHSLQDELAIETLAAAKTGRARPTAQQLAAGAAALLAWDSSGESIDPRALQAPPQLQAANSAFEQAAKDRTLSPLAQTGLAWLSYIDASSSRSSYSPESCDAVFAGVAASASGGALAPQPLVLESSVPPKAGTAPRCTRRLRPVAQGAW